MTITAQIIADSVHPARSKSRITTMQLRYPRFIHAEFMTHRMFSRNASSSRAIPVKKLIEDVQRDPAIPLHWGKNQPGMQAREEHDAMIEMCSGGRDWKTNHTREHAWLAARDSAIDVAEAFSEAGYHKQIVNRLLEPWAHINVVVTATEWDNFFQLRDHEDAQPEIRVLAQEMRKAMEASKPQVTDEHLPYVLPEEISVWPVYELAMLSSARCARVSYLTYEGKKPDFNADMALANKLMVPPWHASPFEHAAKVGVPTEMYANFKGWKSARWIAEHGPFGRSR